MRRIHKTRQAHIAAATATMTGIPFDEAARIADCLGARLYDISTSLRQDRSTIYVWARVADGQVKRVLSVGYPTRACSSPAS